MNLNRLFYSCKFLRKNITSGFLVVSSLSIGGVVINSCSSGSRTKKAFKIADKFVSPHKGKKWGPDMVYTPGGCSQMGGFEGAEVRTVTVSAFYISQCAVSNRNYLIYLDDLQRSKKIEEYKKALLDMNVWKSDFIWNDSLKDYPYARVFLDYPVVGITYLQASTYCKWLTEKEFSMIHKPVVAAKAKPKTSVNNIVAAPDVKPVLPVASVEPNTAASAEVAGQANQLPASNSSSVEPAAVDSAANSQVPPVDGVTAVARNSNVSSVNNSVEVNSSVSMLSAPVEVSKDKESSDNQAEEEFLKLQNEHKAKLEQAYGEQMYFYRLPTEAEWEYAAKASIISQNLEGVESTVIVNFGNIKSSVRYPDGPNKGDFVGLFKRFSGNYKGIPGSQPTDAPTEQVDLRVANGFGLKGCYGNIWEITSDIYRHEPAYMRADYNPSRVDEKFDDKYDETSPLSKKCRVIRGGSYMQSSYILRTYVEEDVPYNDVGFRIVSSVC